MIILGTGTLTFAKGPDGGRDAKFSGTASKFPSPAAPLSGDFIVQAKHTSDPVASCSDKGFANILDAEVPNLEKLVKAGELQHYLVFTNRRKPAGKAIAKESELKNQLGITTVCIFGQEQLRDWLTGNHQIWRHLGFDRFEQKFEIRPDDLTDVITNFHKTLKQPDDAPRLVPSFRFQGMQKKNKINRLSHAYYQVIVEDSLPHFKAIEDFLKNPRNESYRDQYEDTANEIKRKVIAHASLFDSFDEALTYISDLITSNNAALDGKRRFVSVFLHYMYSTCDIGQHAKTIKAPGP